MSRFANRYNLERLEYVADRIKLLMGRASVIGQSFNNIHEIGYKTDPEAILAEQPRPVHVPLAVIEPKATQPTRPTAVISEVGANIVDITTEAMSKEEQSRNQQVLEAQALVDEARA